MLIFCDFFAEITIIMWMTPVSDNVFSLGCEDKLRHGLAWGTFPKCHHSAPCPNLLQPLLAPSLCLLGTLHISLYQPWTRQEEKTSLLNESSLWGGLHCYSIAMCGVEARVSLRFWHHRNVHGLLSRGSFILAMAQSSEIRAKAKIISTVPENYGDKMNISEFFEFSS